MKSKSWLTNAVIGAGAFIFSSIPALGIYSYLGSQNTTLKDSISSLEKRVDEEEKKVKEKLKQQRQYQQGMVDLLGDLIYDHKKVSRELENVELELEDIAMITSELIPVRDKKYDYNNSLVDFSKEPLEELMACVYNIKIEATYKIKKEEGEESEITLPRDTTGFFLKGNYLLTANHVLSLPEKIPVDDEETVEKVKETVYVKVNNKWHELDEVVRSSEFDVAIFRASKKLKMNTYKGIIGSSKELKVGNFAYLAGTPANDVAQLRSGEISSIEGLTFVREGYSKKNSIVIDNGINPGDSGHPVFVLRDGIFELVGICQLKVSNTANFEGIGSMICIDPIKTILVNELKEHPKKMKAFNDLYALFGGQKKYY